ncbi:MAG: hypothetical protein LUD22_03070 [Coprobacillus sp.]|nr:hypothetical protein [Coprobacillus sp.]
MSTSNESTTNNYNKTSISMKASLIVVLISFALSIIDMGLISDYDYEMSAFAKSIVVFLLEGVCSLAFLIGIIVSSIYVAKKKIGPSILVVDIILLLIWVFTAYCSFWSIGCIVGPWKGENPDAQYFVDVSQYHFNFIYYEHYQASLDSRTLITYVDWDYYFPYILFIGNLIVSAVIIPMYVKVYAKHKSENKIK